MPSTNGPEEKSRPRIAVNLQSSGNSRLIREILADRGVAAGEIGLDESGRPAFDLAIVDAAGVARSREFLQRCRAIVEPIILPVLVVVEGRGTGAGRITHELAVTVDDIVRIPSTREELVARIDNLLRLRSLSIDLHARYEQVNLALRGANRALWILHAGNEVLVRVQDEQELLDEICRVIVETEDYELAWAGFVHDDNDPEIVIDAVAGKKAGYTEVVHLSRSQLAEAPAWRSVDTGKTIVVDDILQEPSLHDLQDSLQAWGLASVITIPLLPDSGAHGVLVIYSGTRGDFREDERNVLERLATNIEFGLNALRVGEERDRQKEAVHDLAYKDPLTGLHNRNSVAERLDALLSGGGAEQKAAVLFIDLDRFKIINDALGHGAGDTVLRQVGQRLQKVVRPEDLVARQGGDEFIIVMAEPPRSTEWRAVVNSDGVEARARALAERLVARVREPLIVDGVEQRLGASIGISLYPEHATSADELIDCADSAMYAAKNTDVHVRTYSELITQQHYRRLSLEARLRDALDAEEFRLHYQPQFDLVSGTIVGVEALIRWPQSDGGQLSPAEFIPAAEDTGLIVRIGEWVLHTAIEQRAAWLTDGHDLLMAINVSVRQLKQKDAIREMLAVIDGAVDPSRIELEVTESVLMDGGDQVESTIETLHSLGFRVAIDDFGTGYSSLSRLQNMPINTLKIDKSFVDGVESGGRGTVIARTIQQLGDNLGLCTLAEGIETSEQRESLIELGCSNGQGFLVSGAVPPDQLVTMLGHRFSDGVNAERH